MTVSIDTTPDPSATYLAGRSIDRLRMFGKHQGHHCNFTVIKTLDNTYHLVPNATVIAAVKIAEPGVIHDVVVGDTVFIDGQRHLITDTKAYHDPQLVRDDTHDKQVVDRRTEDVPTAIERRAAERREVIRRAIDIHEASCSCRNH